MYSFHGIPAGSSKKIFGCPSAHPQTITDNFFFDHKFTTTHLIFLRAVANIRQHQNTILRFCYDILHTNIIQWKHKNHKIPIQAIFVPRSVDLSRFHDFLSKLIPRMQHLENKNCVVITDFPLCNPAQLITISSFISQLRK